MTTRNKTISFTEFLGCKALLVVGLLVVRLHLAPGCLAEPFRRCPFLLRVAAQRLVRLFPLARRKSRVAAASVHHIKHVNCTSHQTRSPYTTSDAFTVHHTRHVRCTPYQTRSLYTTPDTFAVHHIRRVHCTPNQTRSLYTTSDTFAVHHIRRVRCQLHHTRSLYTTPDTLTVRHIRHVHCTPHQTCPTSVKHYTQFTKNNLTSNLT